MMTDFSWLFVRVVFVFVKLVKVSILKDNVFFWWIRTLCNTFGERVLLPLLVKQSTLSVFDISFIIIIFLMITNILSSIFSFSNNSVLAFNLVVWEMMFASSKTWSTYCFFDITSLHKTHISFMKKSFNAK